MYDLPLYSHISLVFQGLHPGMYMGRPETRFSSANRKLHTILRASSRTRALRGV